MSTLTAESRAVLVLIYIAWIIVGGVVFALFAPVFLRRAMHIGRRWVVDPVSAMLLGILLFAAGSLTGIGYFLLTMRMANFGQIERLEWYKQHVWATPLIGQGVAALGLGLLIHSYFLDSAHKTKPWRRVLIHFAIGISIVMAAIGAELGDLWHL